MVLKIERSNTASQIPSSANEGELNVNVTDKKLYSANSTVVFNVAGPRGPNTSVEYNDSNTINGTAELTVSTVSVLGTNNVILKVGNSTTNTQATWNTVAVGNSSVYTKMTPTYYEFRNDYATNTTRPGTHAFGNTSVWGVEQWAGQARPFLWYDSGMASTSRFYQGHHPLGFAPWRIHFTEFLPIDNGTGLNHAFGQVLANTAALTSRTTQVTNNYIEFKAVGVVTNTTAGTSNELRNTTLNWFLGNANNMGGFFFQFTIGISNIAANGRCFAGLKDSTTVLANGNPSAQTNIIGFGWDLGQTTMQALSANSTVCTATDMGAGFPTNSGNTYHYNLMIWAPPNSTVCRYQIINTNDGNSVSGVFSTTNLPAVNTLMAWKVWVNNGSTAAASGVDVCGVYSETYMSG